jgi:CheY-like chemotaxis protein
MALSKEDEIEKAISERFYNLVLLDIRMDGFKKDGIAFAKQILELNPFSKIIFVSRFLTEYMDYLNIFLKSGRVLAFSDKKEYSKWMEELKPLIQSYYDETEYKNEVNKALLASYAEAKNEVDPYKKGVMFENFVTILFRNIGFTTIMKRVKDKSLNEVDLIVRNDINDGFLSDFGQYILVECKNKPEESISKNDYILFKNKLENTGGLSNIGFLFTTSKMANTAYIEAVRDSHGSRKVFFVDDKGIYDLLNADDMKGKLKDIIDSQVKDN